MAEISNDDWLLIDIDGDSATFALAVPGNTPAIHGIRRYRCSDFPTATDCIIGFGRDSGVQIKGRRTAVTVSGAVTGDTIRIARCPWILSIRGIGYLIDRPPAVINDSGIKIWADIAATAMTHRPLGAFPSPDVSKPGKYTAINYAIGLGATVLQIDPDGSMRHIETEMGHIAFSPQGAVEEAMHANLARVKAPVGWERVMLAGASDPAWAGTPVANNPALLQRHRAEMLGSFAGDAVLATGGWSGLFLHGLSRKLLSSPEYVDAFTRRFENRASYQTNLRQVPRWTVENDDENLVGAAQYLRHRTS